MIKDNEGSKMNDQCLLIVCPVCGGKIIGDGYTIVFHCENIDYPMDIEPDADPIYCELNQDV